MSDRGSPTATNWLSVCRSWGRVRGVSIAVLDALGAFARPWPRGGPPAPPERSCDSVEALAAELGAWGAPGAGWQDGLAALLAEEVDGAQAAMFVRRMGSVDGLLAAVPGDRANDAALLRILLRVRLAGIRGAPAPRALRVRALADFLYSHAGALSHRDRVDRGLDEVLADIAWGRVGSGLRHAQVRGTTRHGPLFVNLLEVDPRQVRLVASRCRLPGEPGRSLSVVAEEAGAIAATSGGFFLYSEPDIEPPDARYDPVGLLVSDGALVSAPTLGRAALLVQGSEARIEVVRPPGGAVNRAHAERGPGEPSVAVVDDRVVAVGKGLAVPLRGMVVPADSSGLRPGEPYPWVLPADNAMAGGPMLLRDGAPCLDLRREDFWGTAPPRTFSQDETGDTNLLPRMGVGRRPDGTLIFAACDGRDLDTALGWTLRGLGTLLGRLGCTDALNFDGGSSKRMVVRGDTVDLASTEVRGGESAAADSVRPVQTAWLMFERG